jgi:hypothetical protein
MAETPDRAPTYEERVADVIAGADPFAGAAVIGPAQVAAAAAGPPDPVEILAEQVQTYRSMLAHNDTRPIDDDDRDTARHMLAALLAGPWHLVTFGTGSDGIGTHLPTTEIDQEWAP